MTLNQWHWLCAEISAHALGNPVKIPMLHIGTSVPDYHTAGADCEIHCWNVLIKRGATRPDFARMPDWMQVLWDAALEQPE